ncbi:MAG: hypothetical protein HAW67_04610 [Endozoicomonadaceae bacterium]|nr:hypothetical protein [Endozoicomonadaceae bacterium]
MGLDVTAYENSTIVENPECDEWDDCVKGNKIYVSPDFKDHAGRFKDGVVYESEKSYAFYVGSYRRYGYFRGLMAEMAGYDPIDEDSFSPTEWNEREPYMLGCWASNHGFFYEMLNFSDAEGIISTEFSKKLLSDFEKFDGKYKAFFEEKEGEMGSYYIRLYEDFKKAFAMAANNGYVDYD